MDRGSGLHDDSRSPRRKPHPPARTTEPKLREAPTKTDQAYLTARRLAMAGQPVSRRRLRGAGLKGSNESLNALARVVNAELATERTGLP
jgi:hypothetical protein